MKRAAIVVACVLAACVALLAGGRALARARTYQLFGRLIAHVPTSERRVALTFDDGPVSARVDSLLAPLATRGVHATFFVTGAELSTSPEAAKKIVAAGHELGNHTWSHRHMVLIAPSTVRSEIERTDSLIRLAGFRGPIRFRPPYSYKLVALPWYLARHDRTTVMWDLEPDSYPEVFASAEGIVRYTLDHVQPGSIILLHPWYASRATSFAAVGPLIDSLEARGYQVGAVRELDR